MLAIRKKDNRRKGELEEILRRKKKFTAEELYMIAMLYQHGSVPLDYKKAKLFAHRSMNKGFDKAKWLYAAATDRLLMKQGKKQKYGTQYVRNKGKWSLCPVNPKTINKERKKYNVPVIK